MNKKLFDSARSFEDTKKYLIKSYVLKSLVHVFNNCIALSLKTHEVGFDILSQFPIDRKPTPRL